MKKNCIFLFPENLEVLTKPLLAFQDFCEIIIIRVEGHPEKQKKTAARKPHFSGGRINILD